MSPPDGVNWLWPVPLLTRRLPGAERLNHDLASVARHLRTADQADGAPSWASDDTLLHGQPDPALANLAQHIQQAVGHAAQAANQHAWAALQPSAVVVDLVGCWFQMSNRYARHDVHSHGNCSWSGVYYVDVDPKRAEHPDLGEANGLTRLHSPLLDRLGGAAMDLGAAWLQDSHVDLEPEPGLLVVWPSFMLHQVLPYSGDRDRIVVSFNATVHGADGDRTRDFGF